MIRHWSLYQWDSCLNWNKRPGASKEYWNVYILPVLKVKRHLLEFSYDEVFYLHLCESLCSIRTVNRTKCVHEIIQKNLLDECKKLSTDGFYKDSFYISICTTF